MPSFKPNKIFLILIANFSIICLLFGVYFYNSNQNKLANSNSSNPTSLSVSNSQNSSLICENLNRPNHNNWKKVVPENGCPYLEIGSEFSSKKSNSTDFSSSAISNPPKTETQIYTNEFLPNFRLNYPKDWKIETKTKSNGFYQNILTREILLKKIIVN